MLAGYQRMKLLRVVSGAVITAVAFAAVIFVCHPVQIAVTDKDIAIGDEEFPAITTKTKDNQEFPTITTQTKDNQGKHPLYICS